MEETGNGVKKRPCAGRSSEAKSEPEAKTEQSRLKRSRVTKEPEIVKGSWSLEEDELLRSAVSQHGTNWKLVSNVVIGRSAKQCRDRYKLKLDPSINHGPWTEEEDKMLVKLQGQLGNQWTNISKLMPGRTENAVKSRFSSLERSKNREWTPQEDTVLRSCQARGMDFAEISEKYLAKRSEHSVRKRWEKLFMRDLAIKIREELPSRKQQKEKALEGELAGSSFHLSSPSVLDESTMKLNPHHHHQHQHQRQGFSLGITQLPQSPTPSLSPLILQQQQQQQPQVGYASLDSPGFSLSSSTLSVPTPMAPPLNQSIPWAGSLVGNNEHLQPRRISSRSRNLRKQSTSVTVLQQILGEPLKNL